MMKLLYYIFLIIYTLEVCMVAEYYGNTPLYHFLQKVHAKKLKNSKHAERILDDWLEYLRPLVSLL